MVDEEIETVAEDTGKDWEDLIPEANRLKVEEDEKQKEQLQLYLPPRVRKQVNRVRERSVCGRVGMWEGDEKQEEQWKCVCHL